MGRGKKEWKHGLCGCFKTLIKIFWGSCALLSLPLILSTVTLLLESGRNEAAQPLRKSAISDLSRCLILWKCLRDTVSLSSKLLCSEDPVSEERLTYRLQTSWAYLSGSPNQGPKVGVEMGLCSLCCPSLQLFGSQLITWGVLHWSPLRQSWEHPFLSLSFCISDPPFQVTVYRQCTVCWQYQEQEEKEQVFFLGWNAHQ